MSSDWPLKPLQLVASEVTVGYVGSMASEYVEFGVPFLRSLNIEPFGVNTNDLKFITPDFHKRIKKSILRPGDVAIVRTGKPGTCAVIPEWLGEANCSDLVVVRCGEEIRPHFLCYWVNSIASHHISSHTVGAVQQHFNVGAAKTMNVAVPSLKDQDKVLEVLRGLDDRITLLRETNATLEAIAQALFKSWFVDFDPVRAKMAGRAPEGMDEATAALFPVALEETELGLVPKGWRIGQVSDLGDVVCGKTPPTSCAENYGGDVPFITIPDMHGLLAVTATSRSLSRQGADSQAKKYLPAGAVCVSCIATPGLVVQVTEPSQTNQQINSVIPYGHWGKPFPLFLLRRVGGAVRMGGAGGSVFHNLSKSGFEAISVLLPSHPLAQAFNDYVEPLVQRVVGNQKQVEVLRDLRDTLLPRLISGQLRLPESACEPPIC